MGQFYFEQLLGTALQGIDGYNITATVLGVAETISEASRQVSKASEALKAALDHLGGPPADDEHHHHH